MTNLTKTIAFIVFFLALLFMAETGFLFPMITNHPLSRYPLLFHVGISGVFTASLIVLVLLIGINPFAKNDETEAVEKPVIHSWITLTCLACTACLSIPLIFSMVLSMFPLFSTEGMKVLLQVHIYCAAGLLFTGLLFVYSYYLDGCNKNR